jgi:DNA polymerase elongation subunit (family B)
MTDNLKFQVLDWDEQLTVDGEPAKEYIIRLFGRTSDDKTICCTVDDFTPYFFVKLDLPMNTGQIKNFVELVRERMYPKENKEGLLKYTIQDAHDFYGFTNFTKFKFIRFEFANMAAYKSLERVFKKKIIVPGISKKSIKFKVYESNIIPFIRMAHIKQLNSVGWIELNKNQYTQMNNNISDSLTELNIICSWKNLTPYNIIKSVKFIICSFDLECTSIDGSFPNPQRPGDKIIQIGVTLSRYGEDECYAKYILTLGGCSPIAGVEVSSYKTEKKLLLGFTELIRKIDPDMITGYNIFGFDFYYLRERSVLLGIEDEFSKLSRIKDLECEYVESKLASSALGENILKYFKMPGRVVFDLMKVIQRDHRLASYKLDEVAANFIRETILDITYDKDNDKSTIKTKNTNGIYLDQFIKICYNDGMTENTYMDGKKFKIIELTKTSITFNGKVNTEEFMNKGYKVYWSQAKDDISPNDIFRLQEGSDDDRALIAKYCVQDCALCNKLISKLQIITNSIGMAQVCHVPLSFLFLRGQGVKIFSLVAKKCREKNHIIPVLKKKFKPDENTEKDNIEKQIENIEKYFNKKYNNDEEDEDDEDDTGYEGATVFEPKTGVHLEPIPVLDYSSLYPNSMRLRNLSHEMLVNDDKYNNMKGYIYHKITYKNSDNTFTECTFAEKEDGTKGIIPEILTELLQARKKYKNQMEHLKETGGDPFVVAILDGLQQAYKVTANSLYGQTGAPTSPIYMKQIAASTTATGREMLQFSKYFIENVFSKFITLAQTDKEAYLEYIREIYKYYPTEMSLDETTQFHVATVANKPIPDSKFIRNNMEFYCKSNEDMISKYSKQLSLLNINNLEDFDNFIKNLSNKTYEEQSNFKKYLNKLINNKTKKYNNYLEILNINKIDNIKYNVEEFQKDNFITEFNIILNNIGYKNREEMFLKFYDIVNELLDNKYVTPKGIYGDTDSIFYCLHIKDKKTDTIIKDKNALVISINFGIWSSILISTLLPAPMAQEYEKVLWPFIILTKKRYVGNLYEKNPNKFYQKSMGIVLKRRDNANVVKMVCGNIIDQILNKQSIEGAVKKTQDLLTKIITGKIPLDKFIITKTLKTSYKDRTKIVHAVLADRMGERDPGNKPQSNDRIPYAYIETGDRIINLQGDRVEHWDYIIKNNLKLDYLFYITNQIMKPAIQFLELIVENPDRIFNEYIIREENRKSGKLPIKYYLEGDDNDKNNLIDFDEFTDIINKECQNIKKEENKPKKVVKKIIKRIIKKPSNNLSILDDDFI